MQFRRPHSCSRKSTRRLRFGAKAPAARQSSLRTNCKCLSCRRQDEEAGRDQHHCRKAESTSRPGRPPIERRMARIRADHGSGRSLRRRGDVQLVRLLEGRHECSSVTFPSRYHVQCSRSEGMLLFIASVEISNRLNCSSAEFSVLRGLLN